MAETPLYISDSANELNKLALQLAERERATAPKVGEIVCNISDATNDYNKSALEFATRQRANIHEAYQDILSKRTRWQRARDFFLGKPDYNAFFNACLDQRAV